MANLRISEWLKNPNREYDYGTLLYDQYGKSSLLKALFKNGNSPYHSDRLVESLEELNPLLQEEKSAPFKIPKLEEITVPVKRYSVTDEVWNALPESIKDLYTLNSKLHSHSQLLFNQVRISRSDDHRLALGLDILKERSQLNDNWKTIKDYHQKGFLKEEIKEKEEKTVQEMTIKDMVAKMINIPTYLCKHKKKLAKMIDGSKKNSLMLLIQQQESQLELIKQRIEDMS